MVWKNLRKCIGMGVLAGSLVLPLESKANQDYFIIENHVNNQGDERYEAMAMAHRSTAVEGYSSPSDIEYAFNQLWTNEWSPKIVTMIGGHELESDKRPTNSVSKFDANLNVIVQNSQNIFGKNKLGVQISTNSTYANFDSKRHYTAEYKVFSNFLDNANFDFFELKNLRDLCTNANVTYGWTGPTNFTVLTSTNGEFNIGKFTLSCDWNKLLSSSTFGGTNNPQGTQILDYGTNETVSLNANSGNYLDYYVLTRTDNTGLVSVVTNDFVGTGVTSTNVPINNIKGSNSIYAVYAANVSFKTVTATAPKWANVSPPGNTNYFSTNIPSGNSQTFSVSPLEVTNNGSIRERIIGLRRVDK